MPTLVPAQRLARLRTNHDLQNDIDEIRHKKKVLGDRLKPWVVEALKLLHDVDVGIKQLNQTLESVTIATEDPTSQKSVDIAQNDVAQSEGVLPPLAVLAISKILSEQMMAKNKSRAFKRLFLCKNYSFFKTSCAT